MDYTGLKCPVCGKPFTSDDDIVVCPECGAPYHRACYQQAGHCIFQEKHGTPDAWKPPEKQTETGAEGKVCPRCGKKNARESLFCDQCGQLLSGGTSKGASPNGGYSPYGTPNPNASPYQNPGVPNSPPYQNPGAPNIPYSGPYPFAFDPMGGVGPDEPLGDGVTAGDMAKFVQTNPQYYIPAFVNRKRYHRNRFNFSAFLCSGGWMLYRKQYKWGAIFTGIMLLIYVLSTFISYRFATPIIMDLMQQVGVDINAAYPTMEQSVQFMSLLMQQAPWQIFLVWAPSLLSLLRFALMLFVGFNGNRMYMNHCIRKIRTLREENPDPSDYAVRLQLHGGVNTSLAICLLICYMIVVYLPQLFLY